MAARVSRSQKREETEVRRTCTAGWPAQVRFLHMISEKWKVTLTQEIENIQTDIRHHQQARNLNFLGFEACCFNDSVLKLLLEGRRLTVWL